MGTISLSLPVIGQPDTTEDVKIINDFTALQTLLNGNLDSTNWGGRDILTQLVQATSTGMVAGKRYFATAGTTMTLPAPAAGAVVGVVADLSASGSNAVRVSYGSGGGGIYGTGLSNPQSSFTLGSPEASVILQCSNGTDWIIVSGQRDTGWAALTLATGITADTGDSFSAPAARVIADRVHLRGALKNSSGGTIFGTPWATVPAAAIPNGVVVWTTCGNAAGGLQVDAAGDLSIVGSIVNGTVVGLDGANYPLS